MYLISNKIFNLYLFHLNASMIHKDSLLYYHLVFDAAIAEYQKVILYKIIYSLYIGNHKIYAKQFIIYTSNIAKLN